MKRLYFLFLPTYGFGVLANTFADSNLFLDDELLSTNSNEGESDPDFLSNDVDIGAHRRPANTFRLIPERWIVIGLGF